MSKNLLYEACCITRSVSPECQDSALSHRLEIRAMVRLVLHIHCLWEQSTLRPVKAFHRGSSCQSYPRILDPTANKRHEKLTGEGMAVNVHKLLLWYVEYHEPITRHHDVEDVSATASSCCCCCYCYNIPLRMDQMVTTTSRHHFRNRMSAFIKRKERQKERIKYTPEHQHESEHNAIRFFLV